MSGGKYFGIGLGCQSPELKNFLKVVFWLLKVRELSRYTIFSGGAIAPCSPAVHRLSHPPHKAVGALVQPSQSAGAAVKTVRRKRRGLVRSPREESSLAAYCP